MLGGCRVKPPLEQLRDKAIRNLPEPSQLAHTVLLTLTRPQCESLLDLFPYLHGSSHGYGQQGPIRRRLQDKGLIKAKDDGWVPTRLGYEVISILLRENERERTVDAEIRKILSLAQRLLTYRDWDQLMRVVNASQSPDHALQLIRKLLPGIHYQRDAEHPLGGRFNLPAEIRASELFTTLVEKAKSGAVLGYEQ